MPRPPETTYRQRQYVTRDDWTPERLRTARRQADTGNLMLAADLFESMRGDDRISGVLGTRVRGLIRLPVSFEPHEGEEPTPESEALEADFWRSYPESDLVDLMSWGLGLGVGLAEQTWEQSNGRLIPRLRVWSPRWLRWEHDRGAWVLTTELQGDIVIEPGDPKWLLYTPYGNNRPWQRGLWRALGLWWLLKRYAQLDWGTYSEAHGSPLRVGLTAEGSQKADRDELASDLQEIAGVTGIALPPGFDIKLVEATARTYETFERQIEMADGAMAVAVAGQTLTTAVKGSSLAAAQVHMVIRAELIASDEMTFSTALHEQSIRAWTLFNFGSADRAPWARWDIDPPEDLAMIAQTQKVRAETQEAVARNVRAWMDLGISLDLEALAVEYDIPMAVVRGLAKRAESTPGRVQLAAGREPGERIDGFVRGQLYVDRLVKRATPLGRMSGTLREVADAIESSSDFGQLRDELARVFDRVDEDQLAGLEEALVLADFAGRLAVAEDA